MASNANASERIEFVKELMKYKKVDCSGPVLYNMEEKDHIGKMKDNAYIDWRKEKLDIISNYKFTIAFENERAKNYVTEKIYQPLLVKSIPIYWGAPNIDEYFNPKCFIDVSKFNSFEDVIQEIMSIDQDKDLYNSFFQEPAILDNSKLNKITEKNIYQKIQELLNCDTNFITSKNSLRNNNQLINKSTQTLPANNYINQYFDHIYVVNLKYKITDRLKVSKHLLRHGIQFEIFEATNGYEGEAFKKYEQYRKRPLGSLKRYQEYAEQEKQRGCHYIDSAGVMGYIFTYLRILKDAKKHKYKRFLIFEDDIILSKNFENEFRNFIQSIDENWKILQLGASQYGWDGIDLNLAIKRSFYLPLTDYTSFTWGSFAMAIDSSIIDELIDAASAFEAPFDYFPLGELYEKYIGECFIAYPNIVMLDVCSSSIRESRCQYTEAMKVKWLLENFDYPPNKPSISILISSKNNFGNNSNFLETKELPFNLKLFFNTSEGLQPLHNINLLSTIENKILPPDNHILFPITDYVVTLNKKDTFEEKDIVNFIEYKMGILQENTTPLKEIQIQKRKINTLESNMVSVIIPAFNVEKTISRCLDSIINQTYKNLEIIIVNDASTDKTRKIIEEYIQKDVRIICVDKTENKGALQARMTGIGLAKGEYIYSVDADDYIIYDLVKDTVKEALLHNADIVQFSIKLMTDDSKYTSNWTRKDYQEYDKNNFFLYNGNVATIMFKKDLRDVLTKHIGSLSVNYHDDYIISIILSAFYHKVRYIDKAYYVYCDTDNSMTRQYSDETILKYIRDTLVFTRFMTELIPVIFPKEHSDYLLTVVPNRMKLMKNQLNSYFEESKNVNIYDLYNNTDKYKTFILKAMLHDTMQIKDQQIKQMDTENRKKQRQIEQMDAENRKKLQQIEQMDAENRKKLQQIEQMNVKNQKQLQELEKKTAECKKIQLELENIYASKKYKVMLALSVPFVKLKQIINSGNNNK